MENAVRREPIVRALDSRYWRMMTDDLAALVSRRVRSLAVDRLDKVDLIGALLYQDEQETIRHRPAREGDRNARDAATSAAKAHNTTAVIPIFRLSAELRNRIYELAVVRPEPVINTASHFLAYCTEHEAASSRHLPIPTIDCQSLRAHLEPALLRTCKIFRSEAYQLYYARQGFSYSPDRQLDRARKEIPELLKWLGRFGDRLQLLRKIEIEQSIRVPTGVARVCVKIKECQGEVKIRGYMQQTPDGKGKKVAKQQAREVTLVLEGMMPWVTFSDPIMV